LWGFSFVSCFHTEIHRKSQKKNSYLSLSYNPVHTLTQPLVFFLPGQATREFVSSTIAITTELNGARRRRCDQAPENEVKLCAQSPSAPPPCEHAVTMPGVRLVAPTGTGWLRPWLDLPGRPPFGLWAVASGWKHSRTLLILFFLFKYFSIKNSRRFL
jgi:hypothetical protein